MAQFLWVYLPNVEPNVEPNDGAGADEAGGIAAAAAIPAAAATAAGAARDGADAPNANELVVGGANKYKNDNDSDQRHCVNTLISMIIVYLLSSI